MVYNAHKTVQGALASLLGTTFGMPTVAFEAPGEALAASRLHLPTPVSRIFLLQKTRLTR